METLRAFIAVEIGSEIRARLGELQKQLKKANADIRWVQPENMHLTLAFLGNVPVEKFQPLENALNATLRKLEPFQLTAYGTGVFGRRSRPSVVWAGIEESPPLLNLQERVVSALEAAAIPFENKRFHPHLTLGRFKSLSHLDELFQTLEKEEARFFGTTEISSVELIKSELKPTGAEYTVLHRTDFYPKVEPFHPQ